MTVRLNTELETCDRMEAERQGKTDSQGREMTMRLITEFDNVTGRDDRKQRGDRRPIHASKCIAEIPNDGTKETKFPTRCIIVQVQGNRS
jgi:hypothetical protein